MMSIMNMRAMVAEGFGGYRGHDWQQKEKYS
jgi:hypothetical protein